MFRKDEGLTLIELLITIAVIGVVFAIAVPVFNNVFSDASGDVSSANVDLVNQMKSQYDYTDDGTNYTFWADDNGTLGATGSDSSSSTRIATLKK